MSRQIIENNAKQGKLFGHYHSDFLEKDHEVFIFEKIVRRLDLSPILSNYSSVGGAYHSPDKILGVILYGYSRGIYSSRKLEEATRDSFSFSYLSGGNPISYRSICYFVRKHEQALGTLFLSAVIIAQDIGLLHGHSVYSLDGSKFKANASNAKSRKKSVLEKELCSLKEELNSYLSELKLSDDVSTDKEDKRPKADMDSMLSQLDALSDGEIKDPKIKKKSQKYKKILAVLSRNKTEPADKKLNISDPDSRFMKSARTVTQAYNVQIATSDQFIAAMDVTRDENDQSQLIPMSQKLEKNLKRQETQQSSQSVQKAQRPKNTQAAEDSQDDDVPIPKTKRILTQTAETAKDTQDTAGTPSASQHKAASTAKKNKADKPAAMPSPTLLADAGYNRGSNLSYALKSFFNSFIAMNNRKKDKDAPKDIGETKQPKEYAKINFKYDDDSDKWICPEGKSLENYGETVRDGKRSTSYFGRLEDCVSCRVRNVCITSKVDLRKGHRTIEDDGHLISRQEMENKMSLESSKNIYKQRSSDVEAVFGQIKNNRKFRDFLVRGLPKVKAQFQLVCIAHNLGKIMKYLGQNPDMAAEIYGELVYLILRILRKCSFGKFLLKNALYAKISFFGAT